MTVKEYLEKIEKTCPDAAAVMMENVSVWSNDACKGYAIAAAEAAGLSHEQTSKLIEAMETAFDAMTVEEAERRYIG